MSALRAGNGGERRLADVVRPRMAGAVLLPRPSVVASLAHLAARRVLRQAWFNFIFPGAAALAVHQLSLPVEARRWEPRAPMRPWWPGT